MVNCEPLRRFIDQLFRRKSLEEATSLETPLKRCLSTWHMIFYGVSQMAGAGIYVLVGSIIKDEAGPSAVFSFALCALASMFTGLCYVEFSTLVPRAGSCYTFTYITMGELPAFFIGWTMLSDLLLSLASVAKAFSSTADALSHRAISNFTSARMPLPNNGFFDTGPDWLAFGLVLLVAAITAAGAAMSMVVNAVMTVTQLSLLVATTVSCFCLGSISNWENFAPFGPGGVLKGATVAVFAFAGFETIANAAEECKNPRRTVPISLLSTLGIITVVYLSACLGLSYLVNYKLVDIGSPFVVGLSHTKAPWLQYVAAGGTLVATMATKFSTIYVVPRLMYALASDRVIFGIFAKVNPRVGVPLAGLAVGAPISAVAALLVNVETLAGMFSLGTLLSYLTIGVDLYILRFFYNRDAVAKSWAPGFLRYPAAPKIALASYVISGILLGIVCNVATPLATWWSWLLTGVAGVPPILTGVALCAYQPAEAPDEAYKSPLMPLAPMLAMLVNSVLLASLKPLTWLRFLVWTVIGIIIYAAYGFHHSKAKSTEADYVPLTEGSNSQLSPSEETKLSN